MPTGAVGRRWAQAGLEWGRGRLMLRWGSGWDLFFDWKNVRSKWVCLVWASSALTQRWGQKMNPRCWGAACEAGAGTGTCSAPLAKGAGSPNTGVCILTLPGVKNKSAVTVAVGWRG